MPEATPNTETLSQRQQILVPDYLDDPTSPNSDEKIFPSFIDLKRKTLQSLYGLDKNKEKITTNIIKYRFNISSVTRINNTDTISKTQRCFNYAGTRI